MAIFTISPDLLRNIEKDENIYFTDILFVFTSKSNSYKVTSDKKGYVINSYSQVEKNRETIKLWLDFMSFSPSSFEYIDVDLDIIESEETKFMRICKETKSQNKLILYTKQNLSEHKCEKSVVWFEDTPIQILDRDEAKQELNDNFNIGDIYINSQVAKNSSQINNSKNN